MCAIKMINDTWKAELDHGRTGKSHTRVFVSNIALYLESSKVIPLRTVPENCKNVNDIISAAVFTRTPL